MRHPGLPRWALPLFIVLSGCGGNAIGRRCDVQANPDLDQAAFNGQALECPTGLCVKPARDPAVAKPVDTAPYCTAECSTDSDCAGETRDRSDGSDKRCAGGFVCGVGFEVGPLCCRKICLCKDFLPPTGLTTPASCANGAGTCGNR